MTVQPDAKPSTLRLHPTTAMTGWMFITRWGNALLLLPTAAYIAVSMWACGEHRVAWRWIAAFGAAVLLVFASKLAFLGWGIGSRALDFTGISGHSTLAASVLPTFAWWLTQGRGAVLQKRVVIVTALIAVAVGLSRVLLSEHSVSEVVAGLVLGLAVAWVAIPRTPIARARGRLRWVVALALVIFGTFSQVGDSNEAHGVVTDIALLLSGRSTPFTRDMLLFHGPPNGRTHSITA
jgi:membrane-associated phospholipid phosphatase